MSTLQRAEKFVKKMEDKQNRDRYYAHMPKIKKIKRRNKIVRITCITVH